MGKFCDKCGSKKDIHPVEIETDGGYIALGSKFDIKDMDLCKKCRDKFYKMILAWIDPHYRIKIGLIQKFGKPRTK